MVPAPYSTGIQNKATLYTSAVAASSMADNITSMGGSTPKAGRRAGAASLAGADAFGYKGRVRIVTLVLIVAAVRQ